jgi:hypothetical protein
VEDGLVAQLQGPISMHLLKGADLSWLVAIVVAGGLHLAFNMRRAEAPVQVAVGTASK